MYGDDLHRFQSSASHPGNSVVISDVDDEESGATVVHSESSMRETRATPSSLVASS